MAYQQDGAKGERPRGITGRREKKKGNKRSRGNNGAPRTKGFKKYNDDVGCFGGRCTL